MTFTELLPALPQIATGILLADFLRYFVTASAVYLLVWRVFAKPLAGRKILPNPPKPGQMWREFKHSMVTVLVFAGSGVFIFSMDKLGYTRIYGDAALYGRAWWWASLVLLVVAHDAWFYWTHRLLHRPWWFARFHSTHHQSVHPTPWAAYSFHPVEAAIQALFFVLMVHLIPLHGLVLFIFLSWMILRNVIGHSAYELLPWRASTRGPLRMFITNSHHHFHHARNKGNYGLYFTGWDRWMKTEDVAYLQNGDERFMQCVLPDSKPVNVSKTGKPEVETA
jgi:Delta7-sterol 5-desaturase